MGFLDTILGRGQQAEEPQRSADDERAVERYRYLLHTAPPDDIERAHAEAFAKLTPEQRALVLRELAEVVPASESATARDGNPEALARIATRAEVRSPGTLERTFASPRFGGMPGVGGLFAGSLLSSIAGAVIGTTIAHALLGDFVAYHDDHASEFQDVDDSVSDDSGLGDAGGFDDGGFEL